jgi:hypothetical protein
LKRLPTLGRAVALTLLALVPAQAQSPSAQVPVKPTIRFTHEAGAALRALWDASLAAREERVACLASSIRNDTVVVTQVAPLDSDGADSMGISATASVERCGPPDWSGTVHSHVAGYTGDRPSSRFSAQDRIAMRLWYDRWHADGVFCLVYSANEAQCEAEGVVGGMRSPPRIVR